MKTLRQFDSKCRGLSYTYRLVQFSTEYAIIAYRNGLQVDLIGWDKSAITLKELNEACDDIQSRA